MLRNDVYPVFAGLPPPNSASDKELEVLLSRWAARFHLEREKWIHDGALETLSRWQRFPGMRKDLDLSAFRKFSASSLVVTEGVYPFHFEDAGWNPFVTSYPDWLAGAMKRFKEKAASHEKMVRQLARKQGLHKAARWYSYEHLEWLVLWQCGNLSLDVIRKRYPMVGDRTTIWRGIQSAAALVRLALRTKSPPLLTQ
jgi:hypothetical protein